MEKQLRQTVKLSPQIWAIGGGKGGVGKSITSILLAIALSDQNKKTILIDMDFGGANIHTMMGIKTPSKTLNDFINNKYNNLEDICLSTSLENLKIICGANEILSMANPQQAQKIRIAQNLKQLPVDHVILDLGAGASFTVLDFFLIANYPIVIVTPQPISIQNAYGFVRNIVFRKIIRMAPENSQLKKLIIMAMDPKNEYRIQTISDLFKIVSISYSDKVVQQLQTAVNRIKPFIITNIAKDNRDRNAGRIIQMVAEKYLLIQAKALGTLNYDTEIEKLICRMVPISELPSDNKARKNVASLVQKLNV